MHRRWLFALALFCTQVTPGKGADWLAVSLTAHGAASLADGISSWGRYESNPLLRSSDGRFGSRGATIKSGLFGFTLATSLAVRKNRRWRKWAIVANVAAAAAYTGIAARNAIVTQR